MKHLIKEQRRIQSPESLLYGGRFYWKLEDSSYNKLPFEEVTNRKLNFFFSLTFSIFTWLNLNWALDNIFIWEAMQFFHILLPRVIHTVRFENII